MNAAAYAVQPAGERFEVVNGTDTVASFPSEHLALFLITLLTDEE